MKKIPLIIAGAMMATTLGACGPKKEESSINNQFYTNQKEEQLSFEKTYISTGFTYAEGGKFALSLIQNIGTIAAGVYFESPTTVCSGILGLLGTLGDKYGSAGSPTMADVMSKLNEMDTKLDQITDKIDENYNQLTTETARTQAMVDEVLLEEMELAISNFNTNYSVKLGDYERNFADYIDQSYKEYVNKAEDVEITIYQNENKEWVLNSIGEKTDDSMTTLRFNIPSFDNCVTFLDKNYNTVSNGFIDRLEEDINLALEGESLPKGLDKKTCVNYIEANLVENFTKKYYEDNHDKALELKNMTINYAKQVSGKGVKSIIDRYYNRVKFMYNFAGEVKTPMIDLLANLKYNIVSYTGFAAQACLFAGVNQEELKTELENATEVIATYYKNLSDINDQYCYITNTILKGDFYHAKYETWYSNYGNHPTFHCNLRLDRMNCNKYSGIDLDDFNNHKNVITSMDHARLAKRLDLMKEIGIANQDDYIKYLYKNGVIGEIGMNTYNIYLNKGWITDDAYRVFTGLSTRALNSSDSNLGMTCNEKANPDGDYFYKGWVGNFRGAYDANCWSGQIAETTYADGYTGQPMANKRVCAYANYDESHMYWIDDEHCSFIDNLAGNFFFIVENA